MSAPKSYWFDRKKDDSVLTRKNTGALKYKNALTEALALIGSSVDEDLGADDVSEGHEHLHELCISEFLRQMVDE